jgi:hypothetical protein
MKTKFCLYCGEEIKKSWDSCPNCGTEISKAAAQELPKINPFKKRFKNPNKRVQAENLRDGSLGDIQPNSLGYLSILFGILGLVFGVSIGQVLGVVLEITFAILAMIFGGYPLYKGEANKVALGGLILGAANIVLFFYFATFLG